MRKLSAAAVLLVLFLPAGALASLPPENVDGDIIILDYRSGEGGKLSLNGSLIVAPGGFLSLSNLTLEIAPGNRLEVVEGGNLTMFNVTVCSRQQGVLIGFGAWGWLRADNCVISDIGVFSSPSEYLWGGVQLNSENCSISNTTFKCGSSGGVAINSGAPWFENDKFYSEQSLWGPMVEVWSADPVFERCSFSGRTGQRGGDHTAMEARSVSHPSIQNCTFEKCYAGVDYHYQWNYGQGEGGYGNGRGQGQGQPGAPELIDIRGCLFKDCSIGCLFHSDGQGGQGHGRQSSGEQTPVVNIELTRFENNDEGISLHEDIPLLVRNCNFRDNVRGMNGFSISQLSVQSCGFVRNEYGAYLTQSRSVITGCTFQDNDCGLYLLEYQANVSSNTFTGSREIGIHLAFMDNRSVIDNNTISHSDRGISLGGGGTVADNTITGCEYGIYMAVIYQGGQGGGGWRSSSQGPGTSPVYEDALVYGNRLSNNTRAIYTQRPAQITGNRIEDNQIGVEASAYVPAKFSSIHEYNNPQAVSRLRIAQNYFFHNTEGVLVIRADPYGTYGPAQRSIDSNLFESNGIGIGLVHSDADCTRNEFARDGDWAFRLTGSPSEPSNNTFCRIGRLWREELFLIRVFEGDAPPADPENEQHNLSNGSFVDVRDGWGKLLFFDSCTRSGSPEKIFAPDKFTYYQNLRSVNITTYREFADGNSSHSINLTARAGKPGVGTDLKRIEPTGEVTGCYLHLRSAPDISVTGIEFSNASPEEDETLTVSFTVANDLTYDPTNSSLRDVRVDILLDGEPYTSSRIPLLQPGWPYRHAIDWKVAPGNHVWTVTADPVNDYAEANETNNVLSRNLRANGHPFASLEVNVTETLSLEQVLFDASGSLDDGKVVAFLYDFGDGSSPGWVPSEKMTHSYRHSGAFISRVKVQDDLGTESEWSTRVIVTVLNRVPSSSFAPDRSDGLTFDVFEFRADASDPEGVPLTFTWSFGDGGYLHGTGLSNVSHQYSNDGVYNVSLSVSDDEDAVTQSTVPVNVVNRAPVADFVCSPSSGTTLTSFNFISLAQDRDGYITVWNWQFGDGAVSASESPEHAYRLPGEYIVSLTVRDNDKIQGEPCNATVVVRSTVPVVRATSSDSTPRTGDTVSFDARGTFDPDGPLQCVWDFGDGTVSNGSAHATHVYTKPGKYTVLLRVTDPAGEQANTTLTVYVTGNDATGREDAGAVWGTLAWIAGILTIFSALFFIITVRKRENGSRLSGRRKVRRIMKTSQKTDVYALKLARSRKSGTGQPFLVQRRNPLEDAMQPLREADLASTAPRQVSPFDRFAKK